VSLSPFAAAECTPFCRWRKTKYLGVPFKSRITKWMEKRPSGLCALLMGGGCGKAGGGGGREGVGEVVR